MSTPPRATPEITRSLFDEAYGEIYSLPTERFEVEVLEPLPPDVVRLFFELADEALCDPSRDNPFAAEKRVFELSSESLAQELARLQRLGEAALLSFNRTNSTQSAGQLPAMLAKMYVGATRVRPAALSVRLAAAVIDLLPITAFAATLTAFIAWFTTPQMRASLLGFDAPALIATLGLLAATVAPISIIYYLRPGRSLGYRLQHLEAVNAKSGNPVNPKTGRRRAWLAPLGIPSLLLASLLIPGSRRWLSDHATSSTIRKNLALRSLPTKVPPLYLSF